MNRLRSVRVRQLIEAQGRVYRPPRSDVVTINADGIGLRIATNMLEIFDQSAQVALLNYADEELRTIDSVLVSEADIECEYAPILNVGDEVYV